MNFVRSLSYYLPSRCFLCDQRYLLNGCSVLVGERCARNNAGIVSKRDLPGLESIEYLRPALRGIDNHVWFCIVVPTKPERVVMEKRECVSTAIYRSGNGLN